MGNQEEGCATGRELSLASDQGVQGSAGRRVLTGHWDGKDPNEVGINMAKSQRHHIAKWLREAIVRGIFAPGEQLRQEALCESFHASPAPVREALRQLESEGLLIHRPNRGVYVAETSVDELIGVLFPIRLALEQYALTRPSRAMTEVTLGQLRSVVEVMEESARDGDFVRATEADLRFHEICVLQANSAYVSSMWTAVYSRVRVELYRFQSRLDVKAIPDQHWDLIETIRSQDAEQIRTALQDHILASAAELLEYDAVAYRTAQLVSYPERQQTPPTRDQDYPPGEEKGRAQGRTTGLHGSASSQSRMHSSVDAETSKNSCDLQ